MFDPLIERIIKTKSNRKVSIRLLSKSALFLLVLALVTGLVDFAQATTESLNVQAGKEFIKTIDLAAEDQIRITFTFIGSTPDTLHFWMVFPNATTRGYGEISQSTISFISDVQGLCELHFDNSNSSSAQLITLNYEIEHYIFGIPQIPFLIIVIAVLLLAVVAGYIIMGKYA